MAAHTRFAVVRRILATGLVPVVPLADRDAALGIARACHAGGARVLEFTNRGDGANRSGRARRRHLAVKTGDRVETFAASTTAPATGTRAVKR
jgi:2-keto-3-deoxy-6-phosphogluconate aldolase